MSEILTRLRGYNPPDRTHDSERIIAQDISDAADEIERLRLALAEAHARIALDNAVCLCGCPASEHEDNGEDGEQCEHEDHECLRVAPAVLEIVGRVRLALAEATREAETLKTERNAALTLAEQRGSAYDMRWREVESLRERLDKEQEERGRQYGLRLQIADEFAFLRELLVAVVKTGTKDPLLDARITEELRSHE